MPKKGPCKTEEEKKQFIEARKSPIVNAMTFENEDEKNAIMRKNLMHSFELWKQPKVKDDNEAEERLTWYFSKCAQDGVRPTVEGLALAMGTNRVSLWDWESGRAHGPVSPYIIKAAKEMIACFDATMVEEGKLNPVAYIFRAKNYYGMKDQTEHVVTPNVQETDTKVLLEQAEMLPEID